MDPRSIAREYSSPPQMYTSARPITPPVDSEIAGVPYQMPYDQYYGAPMIPGQYTMPYPAMYNPFLASAQMYFPQSYQQPTQQQYSPGSVRFLHTTNCSLFLFRFRMRPHLFQRTVSSKHKLHKSASHVKRHFPTVDVTRIM
jgi:hypothetical protein